MGTRFLESLRNSRGEEEWQTDHSHSEGERERESSPYSVTASPVTITHCSHFLSKMGWGQRPLPLLPLSSSPPKFYHDDDDPHPHLHRLCFRRLSASSSSSSSAPPPHVSSSCKSVYCGSNHVSPGFSKDVTRVKLCRSVSDAGSSMGVKTKTGEPKRCVSTKKGGFPALEGKPDGKSYIDK